MKKLKQLFILFTVFSLIIPGIAHAEEMFLTEGEFVVLGNEPSAEDYLNQVMFWDAVLEIDDKGKVKGYAGTSINDILVNKQYLTANVSLKMEGEYSYEENKMAGTFTAKHSWSSKLEQEKPLVSYYGNGNMTFSGTFSGGYSSEDGAMKVVFKGKKHIVDHLENSNDFVADDDRTKNWTNTAFFTENFCDSLVKRASSRKFQWAMIPSAQARDSGARFSDFSGEVTVFPDDDPDDTRPAEMESVIRVEDHIKTEDDSCAILSFADMTTFVMKPNSEIILDTPPDRKSKISLIAGDIWVNVKKMFKDGSMDVTMKQAVAGIKGTTFVASERSGVSTLKVIEGKVEYRSLVNPDQVVAVSGGEILTADSSGLGTKTNFDIAEESDTWKNKDFAKKFAEAPELIIDNSFVDADIDGSTEEAKSNNFIIILIVVAIIGGIIFFRKKSA